MKSDQEHADHEKWELAQKVFGPVLMATRISMPLVEAFAEQADDVPESVELFCAFGENLWLRELRHRLDGLIDGTREPVDADKVFAEARARLMGK